MEIFQPIKNYEDKYLISSEGRVWSLISDKFLKVRKKTKQNYYVVGLQGRTFSLHRLVAQHFINNPYCKPAVNHKDGNGLNNNWTNLEWCEHSANIEHYRKTIKRCPHCEHLL